MQLGHFAWTTWKLSCSYFQEEALELVKNFRHQIISGNASFEDVARRESHCSSARRGGDLGEFGPGQMQAPFENAAYALKV